MKKIVLVLAAIALVAFAVSCASTSNTTIAAEQGKSSNPYVVVDYKNKDLGAAIPEWVTKDVGELEAEAAYKDVYVFKVERLGGNLNAVQVTAQKLNADSELARMISLRVQNLFTGAQVGDDNLVETYFEDVVKSLADAQVSGSRKVSDFWVLREYTSNKKQEYRYLALYTIPKDIVKTLIQKAIDGRPADTQEKVTARDRVKQVAEGSLSVLTDAQNDGLAQ